MPIHKWIASAAGGTIQPIGGTLNFTNPLLNAAGGNIQIDAGTKLLASGGLGTNAGIVTLSGGTLSVGVRPVVLDDRSVDTHGAASYQPRRRAQ